MTQPRRFHQFFELFSGWRKPTAANNKWFSRSRYRKSRLELLEDRLVLSGQTLYVNDNWAITNDVVPSGLSAGDMVANTGAGDDGTVTGKIFDTNAFSTIQDAINAANPGDTIDVLAGTYAESVLVDKSVTLIGAQHGVDARTRSGTETILDGTTNSGKTLFSVTANDVTIDGFTIQGATNGNVFGAAVWLEPGTHGTQILNNIVQDNITGLFLSNNSSTDQAVVKQNLFQNNTEPGPSSGTDIYADQFTAGIGGVQNVLIDNNTFTNTSFVEDSWGIGISNTDPTTQFSSITVSNNSFSNVGRGIYFYDSTGVSITANTVSGATHYAVGLFGNPSTPANSQFTITDNTLDGNGTGIELEDDGAGDAAYAGGNLDIANDFLDNNSYGVLITSDALGAGASVTVDQNHIQGNSTAGLENDSTTSVDARSNWWGSTFGPSGSLNSFSNGAGDLVLGNVLIAPWLTSGTDTQPAVAGFQPSGVTFGPITNDEGGTFATFQSAIAGTDPGHVITAANGTYFESNILVTKSLTIQGHSRAGVILGPSVADGHIDSAFAGPVSNGFVIQSSGVTIQDLTIDGNANTALNTSSGQTQNFRAGVSVDYNAGEFDDTVVTNASVENIYRRGVSIYDFMGTRVTTGNVVSDSSFDEIGTDPNLNGDGYAIIMVQSSGSITDNTITNSGNGIATNFSTQWPTYAPTILITGNNISAFATTGVIDIGIYAVGLALDSQINNNIIDTTGDTQVDDGIVLTYLSDVRGTQLQVEGNQITTDKDDVAITVSHRSFGVSPTYTPVLVSGNTLLRTGTGGSGQDVGIVVSDTDNLGDSNDNSAGTLSTNMITGYHTGIMTENLGGFLVSATIGGNTITGIAGSTGISIGNRATASVDGNTFSANATDLAIATGGTVTSLTGNSFTGTQYIENLSTGNLDATTDKFNVGTSHATVLGSNLTLSEAFTVEDRIVDAVDSLNYGLVRIQSGQVFVTPNSFFAAGGTTTPDIQRAITVANSGDTVNISAGSYNNNLSINKSLTVAGAGSGSTTVNATGGVGAAISGGPTTTVTLQGLSIIGASSAINNSGIGTLTLRDVASSGSTSGGTFTGTTGTVNLVVPGGASASADASANTFAASGLQAISYAGSTLNNLNLSTLAHNNAFSVKPVTGGTTNITVDGGTPFPTGNTSTLSLDLTAVSSPAINNSGPGAGSLVTNPAATPLSWTHISNVTSNIALATHLVMIAQPPATVTAGSGFGLSVGVDDAHNHLITNYNGTVTLVLQNNPGSSTLGGTLVATVHNGIAVFTGLTLNHIGSNYTILATGGALASTTTSGITVVAGAATQLLVSPQPPSSVTAGQGFGFKVTVEDAQGNVVKGFTGHVAVAIANNPGNSKLGGTVSISAVNGVASFSGLTLNKVGSPYTLRATSGSLAAAITDGITVIPGAATQLVVSSQPPSSVMAGTGFGFSVTAEDAQGNVATGFTGSVAVAILNNPGNSKLSGMVSVPAAGGVANFSGLTLNKVGSPYTLRAISSQLTSVTTSGITVIPGTATQLLISTQPPTSVAAGTGFGFSVTAEDAQGNVVKGFTGSVTVAILNNPNSGTLGGILSVSAVGGVASFKNLTLDKVGSPYTLRATSNTLASATTNGIMVIAGAATHFVFNAPPTVNAGVPFNFTATAEDAFNNVVTGDSRKATLTSSDTSAKFVPNHSTFTSGQLAVAATLSRAGSQTIQVSDGSITGSFSTRVIITTGASILVLDPTASGALTLSGNAVIQENGMVVVDSSSATALQISGNAQVTATGIRVVGSAQQSGSATFQPSPTTGIAAVTDPLIGLAAPAAGVSRGSVNISGKTSLTINPGIYSQIIVSGNATLKLNPGIYEIAGGGFNISGNGTVTGSGVLVYNAGSAFPNAGGSFGSINLSGNSSVSLTAATTGAYAGISIFQSRDNTTTLQLSGNALLGSGTVYAPAALLNMVENSNLSAVLIVDKLALSDNADPSPFLPVRQIGLSEAGQESPATTSTTFMAFQPGMALALPSPAAGVNLSDRGMFAAVSPAPTLPLTVSPMNGLVTAIVFGSRTEPSVGGTNTLVRSTSSSVKDTLFDLDTLENEIQPWWHAGESRAARWNSSLSPDLRMPSEDAGIGLQRHGRGEVHATLRDAAIVAWEQANSDSGQVEPQTELESEAAEPSWVWAAGLTLLGWCHFRSSPKKQKERQPPVERIR